MKKVLLDDLILNAETLQCKKVQLKGKELHKLIVDFKVRSEDYHHVTTKLYENDFIIKIPEEKLEFSGTIHKYSTSITNLYEVGAVGDYHLELVEKPS
ncbi:DUF3219 family protein [Salinibacillus kushneri]|nr:DUF3219 family protein [Salinibacillus kushneri]